MKKKMLPLFFAVTIACFICICFAEQVEWKDGGPKYLYIKSGEISSRHSRSYPYNEQMKCMDCHKYDGIDAYTAATMTLKKSKIGRLPQDEIKQAILEALKGLGNYREMYVLSTSFNNKPLATCIEFTIDPKTFTFYASSEKQTEKLFHIASNPNVSMVYVKQRDDKNYFADPVGVQIVGQAKQLKDGDPEFDEAFDFCLSTVHLPPTVKLTPEMISEMKKNQLVTKVTPERIIISNFAFRKKGNHFKQIWESEKTGPR